LPCVVDTYRPNNFLPGVALYCDDSKRQKYRTLHNSQITNGITFDAGYCCRFGKYSMIGIKIAVNNTIINESICIATTLLNLLAGIVFIMLLHSFIDWSSQYSKNNKPHAI
jgi:hypothetical protein